MTSITITLSDEVMVQLRNIARRHRTVPEEYLRVKIEELVESSTQTSHAKSTQEITKFVDETYGKYACDDSILNFLLEEKALDKEIERKKFSAYNG